MCNFTRREILKILSLSIPATLLRCSKKDLLDKCKDLKILFSNEKKIRKENFLNLLISYFFEKKAKKNFLYIIYDFPHDQAALAKIVKKNNHFVAKRFEFFFNGLEIANGYFELNDEKILRNMISERFV